MQAKHHESKGLFTAVVLGVLVALVGLGGAIKLAQSAAELGPQVGDMVTFEPGRHIPHDTLPQVTAGRNGQPDCVLDLGVIRRFGGSLVIETRTPRPDRAYRVHWAGLRSSDGTGNCGGSAELMLSDDKLEELAIAAGGYGVSHKQLVPVSLWSSRGATGSDQ